MIRTYFTVSAILVAIVALIAIRHPDAWWSMTLIGPLILLGGYDLLQTKHTILRNFPIIGYFRYFFEFISPELQQYFIERHTDGMPLSRNHRSVVYKRAKDIEAKREFVEICEAMKSTGIVPDFITVDGAEGGTGAAPLEYSDAVGMPIEPALRFVDTTLREHGLRDEVRLIASGKAVTASSIIRLLSIGADTCNSARAFMLSIGCIQAQRCDTNKCPTGITTQNPRLVRGLVVEEKELRVANFHRNTVRAVVEMAAACGVGSLNNLSPGLFMHGTDWRPTGGPPGESPSWRI